MTTPEDTRQGRKRKLPEFSNMDLNEHSESSHSNGCGTRNSVVQALLTDLYQITMAYAYWKANKCQDHAVFELFFRKNPFRGEFTIFAGLEDCLTFLENFQYSNSGIQLSLYYKIILAHFAKVANKNIEYLRKTLPVNTEPEFFNFLQSLSAKELTVYAIPEGSVVFPRTPLMRVEGPLPIVQLVETTLLTLVNFASLITTNAARYRLAAGNKMKLFEFGLRRAQGPDGGLSASKYAFMGGFDATSNVLAGKLFNIPVSGTHAHAYVTSFSSLGELTVTTIKTKNIPDTDVDVVERAKEWRAKLSHLMQVLQEEANDGELAAFISFAVAFPDGFLALIDTYDVLRSTSRPGRPCLTSTYLCRDSRFRSGLLNFCAVALMLNDLGYRAIGVRVDSGDLAYLSNLARSTFTAIAEKYNISWFTDLMIIASNDINEETIISLNEQGHKINCFGIGTHLVTCQRQPALGCVYKMVEVNNNPRIKLSQDVEKITMPGRKSLYRLYGNDGHALIDLLQRPSEPRPQSGKKVLCRHPFQESKRAYVSPTKVESLVKLYWENGHIVEPMPSLAERRNGVEISLKTLRSDIKRHLNPTPYKVSVSDKLYNFIHDLWLQNAPIGELY